jgi:hypothetical protein
MVRKMKKGFLAKLRQSMAGLRRKKKKCIPYAGTKRGKDIEKSLDEKCP